MINANYLQKFMNYMIQWSVPDQILSFLIEKGKIRAEMLKVNKL
jgi:hypothetical protein